MGLFTSILQEEERAANLRATAYKKWKRSLPPEILLNITKEAEAKQQEKIEAAFAKVRAKHGENYPPYQGFEDEVRDIFKLEDSNSEQALLDKYTKQQKNVLSYEYFEID